MSPFGTAGIPAHQNNIVALRHAENQAEQGIHGKKQQGISHASLWLLPEFTI